MKIFAAKLALYLPSVAVLGLIWVTGWFWFVPLGPWHLTGALCVMGMLFGLSWALVAMWFEISKFVNRRFGG